MARENLVILSFKDFLTAPMLKLALMPFIVTFLVTYILFFMAADAGIDALQESSVEIHSSQTNTINGITHTETRDEVYQGGSEVVSFLMRHAITAWFVSAIIYVVGTVAALYFSIFISILIIGMLTPWILPIIHQRHYAHLPYTGYGNILSAIWKFVTIGLITLLLFIIMAPLYFIPLLGQLLFFVPFYYFFHKLITYDVASTIMTKAQYKQIMYFNGTSIRMKTGALYLLSLIPFVALFFIVYFVIYIGHSFFAELDNLESKDKSTPHRQTVNLDTPKALRS